MLTVGDNDRNEVSCRETASRPGRGSNLPCDQESNTFTAELSVLILFKMIESIDMTLCVISFLVQNAKAMSPVNIRCCQFLITL